MSDVSDDDENPFAFPLKSGLKPVQTYTVDRTNADWFITCVAYIKEKKDCPSLSYGRFLNSSLSGPKFMGTRSQCVSMGVYLKKFHAGTLKQVENKRSKKRKFVAVEEKLVHYRQLRATNYQMDKCGVSWLNLRMKCTTWHSQDPTCFDKSFTCLPGWLSTVLKRHGLVGVRLHGEANEKDS